MQSYVIFESKKARDKHVIGTRWSYRRYLWLKKVPYFTNFNTYKYFKVEFVCVPTLVLVLN